MIDMDWNPMEEASESIKNTMSFSIADSVSVHRNPEDIPCPFQKEPNKPCFKGRNCPHKHGQYTATVLHSHPKLLDRPNTYSLVLVDHLPKKEILTDAYTTLAWVTAVVDPGEFYVVMKGNQSCLCGSKNNEEDEEVGGESSAGRFGQSRNSSRTATGLDELHTLWKEMQKHYCIVKDQPMIYFAGELVAVRLSVSSTTKKAWFRAVVLEDTDNDLDADRAPPIHLKLLDYGIEVTKTTLDVAPLHERFALDPPMAFKCSLYGISPLLGQWGKRVSTFFKNLVSGQIIILEVKQTPSVESFDIFDKSPVQVGLYAKCENKYVNVVKLMGDRGQGIEWNPFPTRPFVNEVLPHNKCEYLIKTFTTDADQESLVNESRMILERENSRLKCFINSLNS